MVSQVLQTPQVWQGMSSVGRWVGRKLDERKKLNDYLTVQKAKYILSQQRAKRKKQKRRR